MKTPRFVYASNKGFTMLEMLVVLAIAVTVMTIAFPSYVAWRQSVEFRTTARTIVYAFRDAKNRSVTNNIQHRIEFEWTVPPAPPGPTGRYRMVLGDRAANSQAWPTVVQDWVAIPTSVSLNLVNLTVNAANNRCIDFNPSGTVNIAGNPATIATQDSAGTTRFTVEVSNSGRIRIQ
jgi:prepilin-type N-terminal cleavage/methylation domain-containing protein